MDEENLPEGFPEPASEEGLNIKNELLKLKMRAELGAFSFEESNLPPDIENAFLKNVLAFEQEWAKSKSIKVYEKLSKPEFVAEDKLNNDEITEALLQLEQLLKENNIQVNYLATYSDRVKYKFLTEELFDEQIDDMDLPGTVINFIYEEFHPNHKNDIISKAENFIENWFDKNITDGNADLASDFILPEGKLLAKKEVVNQIHNIFSLTEEFIEGKYKLIDVDFDLMNEGNGMGYVEGLVEYKAVLATGENEVITGPFKIYFSLEYNWWQIMHIVFPGFEY